jgi:hypothetical protein
VEPALASHNISQISILPVQRKETDYRGLNKLFETPEDKALKDQNRLENQQRHAQNVAEKQERDERRQQIAADPDLAEKRNAHANKQEQDKQKQAQQIAKEEQERAATQSTMNTGAASIATLRAKVRDDIDKEDKSDITNWNITEAVNFWSACDKSELETARAAALQFIGQVSRRRMKIAEIRSALQAKNIKLADWTCESQLLNARYSMSWDDFDTLANQWKSAMISLEAVTKTVVDSTTAKAPEAEDADAVQAIRDLLDARKTKDEAPPSQLEKVMQKWGPLKIKLLHPLYVDAKGDDDKINELIERSVTHNLVIIRQTNLKRMVSDAKGATSQKDVGISTAYALEGLPNITIHVHWRNNQVGSHVAAGDNPAHWKTKSNSRQLGASTRIPDSLARQIHSKAINKYEK